MSLDKPLNEFQLKNWFNEKFRDEFLIKSLYDKQAHKQILNLIENNGNSSHEGSNSIIKRLDEIQAAIKQVRKYQPMDIDTLREKLKSFMADKDLSIHDVAGLIKKDPKTIWQFLHQKVKPHNGTVYKIKELVGSH